MRPGTVPVRIGRDAAGGDRQLEAQSSGGAMIRLMQVATAAVVLAVAVLAGGAFAPAGGAPHTVPIAPGDDAVLAARLSSQKPSKPATKPARAGEAAPEVLAEEWIATGGGSGGGGSPKG